MCVHSQTHTPTVKTTLKTNPARRPLQRWNNVNKPTCPHARGPHALGQEIEEGGANIPPGSHAKGGAELELRSYGKRVRSEHVWRADAVGIRPKLEPLTPKIAWVPLRRGHANLLCIVPILVYVLREQYTYST